MFVKVFTKNKAQSLKMLYLNRMDKLISVHNERGISLMKKLQSLLPGLCLCFGIAAFAWFCGKRLPIIGGAVFGILF